MVTDLTDYRATEARKGYARRRRLRPLGPATVVARSGPVQQRVSWGLNFVFSLETHRAVEKHCGIRFCPRWMVEKHRQIGVTELRARNRRPLGWGLHLLCHRFLTRINQCRDSA